MKKITSILFALTLLSVTVSTSLGQTDCSINQWMDQVLTDVSCPGPGGKIKLECVEQDNKCCTQQYYPGCEDVQ